MRRIEFETIEKQIKDRGVSKVFADVDCPLIVSFVPEDLYDDFIIC